MKTRNKRGTESLPHYGVKNGLVRKDKTIKDKDGKIIKLCETISHAKYVMRTGHGL